MKTAPSATFTTAEVIDLAALVVKTLAMQKTYFADRNPVTLQQCKRLEAELRCRAKSFLKRGTATPSMFPEREVLPDA